MPLWFIALQGFLLGACIGSFLNVVMYRIPIGPLRRANGEHFTINVPSSHCPVCRHALAWYDNLPIIGWLLLRGRCRYCGVAIPARYAMFETGAALFAGMCAYTMGWCGLGIGIGMMMWLIPGVYWWSKRMIWNAPMWRWVAGLGVLWFFWIGWMICA